jgi:hypothetical protein
MQHPDRHQVRIRIQGELDPAWSSVLAGLAVTAEADGTTLVEGELPDQAAVHGLLGSIRDFGLPLVSVETAAVPAAGSPTRR